MEYKPKVITGKVTGTGLADRRPCTLVLTVGLRQPRELAPLRLGGLRGRGSHADRIPDRNRGGGLCLFDTLEKFTENWKAKKWEPQGSFCLPLDKVEVLEVKQEESTNNTREQLRAHGFDLTPRKQTDRGGILCLPAGQEPEQRRAGQAPGLGARRVPDMRPEMLEAPGS